MYLAVGGGVVLMFEVCDQPIWVPRARMRNELFRKCLLAMRQILRFSRPPTPFPAEPEFERRPDPLKRLGAVLPFAVPVHRAFNAPMCPRGV